LATDRERRPPRRPPAKSLKGREDELIAAAMDLAEKKIRDGTASSQVLAHFLKLGSTREQLEQQKLRGDVKLLDAKVDSMESAEHMDQMYAEAIAAMKRYQGHPEEVIE
jgi:hypothetical protein